jgi:hypothetical protein
MIKELIFHSSEIFEFLRGFIILNIILLPISMLITVFIGIMGSGNPQKPSLWKSIGISAGFIYGIPIVLLLFSIIGSKVIDSIFRINPISQGLVSWFSLIITSLLLTILTEILVDNSFQFKQGNYEIIISGLIGIMVFLVIVYFAGCIPLPWISSWFR